MKFFNQTRFTDPRLADDQHELPVAADEGRKLTHAGAASAAARPHNEEQVDGFGYAIQLARAPFLRDEEAWDLAQNVCGDEHRPRLGSGLDTRGDVRGVANHFAG